MRFVADTQLPPALARFLVEAGHLADHTHDIALNAASDSAIWEYVLKKQALLRRFEPLLPSIITEMG